MKPPDIAVEFGSIRRDTCMTTFTGLNAASARQRPFGRSLLPHRNIIEARVDGRESALNG
jgi:hypothetical protein